MCAHCWSITAAEHMHAFHQLPLSVVYTCVHAAKKAEEESYVRRNMLPPLL